MKLSNFVPQLKALNWSGIVMKGAIILVIALAVGLASYFKGKSSGQVQCAEAQAKAMETLAIDLNKQINDQQSEMALRFKDAQTATEEFVKTQEEIKNIQRGIADAIKLRASNPACSPTAAERRMYQAIADKTRNP